MLAAFLFLDADAAHDGTARRKSTFENGFPRLRLFTRRPDPSGREEQFERFYLLLLDSNPFQPSIRAFEVDNQEREIDLDAALDDMIELLGERNFDLYDGTEGRITKL
ncbi:hypothetical protein [Agrococcus sp. TSP3-2-1]|uniref:hypothetical protein n=1 Tax=Agrococcus sp. TSP3-2-1 TaxID=2804583 RepID=UPI003CE800FB